MFVLGGLIILIFHKVFSKVFKEAVAASLCTFALHIFSPVAG